MFNRGYDVDTDALRGRLGLILRETTAPDTRIGLQAAGAVPYFADRPGVDFLGKSDRVIAKLEWRGQVFWPGHNKVDGEHSIGRLRPDIVIQPVAAAESLQAWGYEPHEIRVGAQAVQLYVLKSALDEGRVCDEEW